MGLSMWGGARLYFAYIGDADSRIHLYNSHSSQTILLSISLRGTEAGSVKPRSIELMPGKGISYQAIHAGEYVIDIVSPADFHEKQLTVDVPARDVALDVLLDIGGQGEFFVFPLFSLPTDIPPDQRE